jgi:anti-sigma B factor antagonist
MEASNTSIKVGVFDNLVVIKIAGRANFTTSIDFKKLINELHSRGHTRFVIELSECQMMDSTFLGVLAGVGLKFSGADHNGVAIASLELLNPNSRISELLESLGVADLFTVRMASDPSLAVNLSAVQACNKEKIELTKNCLDAHELLMKLNPENVGKFKDVARFFAEDLKRLQEESEK